MGGFKLTTDEIKNIITKRVKNEKGVKKLTYEIKFYQFIIDNHIPFPIPKIYKLDATNYSIETIIWIRQTSA